MVGSARPAGTGEAEKQRLAGASPLKVIDVQKWQCKACPYVYDPEIGDPDGGIPPGTAFEDLPDDWLCPDCVLGKEFFEPLE